MPMRSLLPRLPPRGRHSHKGDFGRVLVVAGSRGMTGAAALCTAAAVRGGAGLVTCATPQECYPIVAARVVEALFAPLPATAEGAIAAGAGPRLREIAAACDVVAAGPGLTTGPETARALAALLGGLDRPAVLDADALTIAAGRLTLLGATGKPVVVTPHPGEMARLAKLSAGEVQRDRRGIAADFARAHGCVVVLKGHQTVVTDGRRVRLNRTGNPGMATGGAGDVLTGVIAALLAQKMTPFDAAMLGAHLHGLAGDLAARERSEVGLTASDILDFLPAAFKRVT